MAREYIDIYPENQKNTPEQPLFLYILQAFNQDNPPRWIVKADVAAFFDNIMHGWLIENIPMDKAVLRKFLRAGVVKDGEFV